MGVLIHFDGSIGFANSLQPQFESEKTNIIGLGITPQYRINNKIAIVLNKSDIEHAASGDVNENVEFTGDLAPSTKVIISAEVDEEVKEVLVKEGDFVKKSQLLAVFDDTDLAQNLSETKAQLEIVKSQFKLDKIKLEQNKDLYQQGFISKIAYDELNNSYQTSLQKINQQQAILERNNRLLRNTRILAPFNGYIYQKNIDSGQYVNRGNKLFALANLDKMQITTAIPNEQIGLIKINQTVKFTVENSNKIYFGIVSRINPVAEAGTRSYSVYIDFINTDTKLKAGQFVKGKIVVKTIKKATYVPSSAVRHDNNGDYVYLVKNGVVEYKKVNILVTDHSSNITAIDGINIGDILLSGNIVAIKDKDHVNLIDE